MDYNIDIVRGIAAQIVAQVKSPFDKQDFINAFRQTPYRFPTLAELGYKTITEFILSTPNVHNSVAEGEFFYLHPESPRTPDDVRLDLIKDRKRKLLDLQFRCLAMMREIGHPFEVREFMEQFAKNPDLVRANVIRKSGFKNFEEFIETIPHLEKTLDGKYCLAENRGAASGAAPSNPPLIIDPLQDHMGLIEPIGGNSAPPPSVFGNPFSGAAAIAIPQRIPHDDAGDEMERKPGISRFPVESSVPPSLAENNSIIGGQTQNAEERAAVVGAGIEGGGEAGPPVNVRVKVERPEPDEDIIFLEERKAPRAKRPRLSRMQENVESVDVKPEVPPHAPMDIVLTNTNNNTATVNIKNEARTNSNALPDQLQTGNNTGSVIAWPFGMVPAYKESKKPDGPTAKSEAFGLFLAWSLDDAEKQGKNVGALRTKIMDIIQKF